MKKLMKMNDCFSLKPLKSEYLNENIKSRHKFLNSNFFRFTYMMTLKIKFPWYKIDQIFRFSKHYKNATKNFTFFRNFIGKIIKDHEEEFPRNKSAKPKIYLDHLYTIRNTLGGTIDHIEGVAMFLSAGH